MSIIGESDLRGMKRASEAVARTLFAMMQFVESGMSTLELDRYGESILKRFGARSAPRLAYNFPGCTCLSVNLEVAHGIPSERKVLQEGDLLNIDVSAERDGYWADNGASMVIGRDIHNHNMLIEASKDVLKESILSLYCGMQVAEIGSLIHEGARSKGYKVIRNLTGHGIGRKLHEAPREIANYCDPRNSETLAENAVVAIETFISDRSSYANVQSDGWTLTGDRGGYVAQHEHTVWVSTKGPVILTAENHI